MIDWNIKYTPSSAALDFEKLEIKDQEVKPIKVADNWLQLREQLIQARDEVYNELKLDEADSLGYSFDVAFGIKLYDILSEKNGFNLRIASNDEIWTFLSIRVIPDIVHARFGLNADHYYKIGRRVWLKNIWWYIYLAWTGTPEGTVDLIKDNSTDTILQMVERPGLGYYTEVDREILRQYHSNPDRFLFRRVLKLNTARLLTTSPELVEGGIEAYVRELFTDASEE